MRNVLAQPAVVVRIRDQEWRGTARLVVDAVERDRAAELVHAKYQPGYRGDLSTWRAMAHPVAVVLADGTGSVGADPAPA